MIITFSKIVFYFMFLMMFVTVIGRGIHAKLSYVPGEILLKLKDKKVSKNSPVDKLKIDRIIKLGSDEILVARSSQKSGSFEELLKELNENPAVEYAEPNYIYSIIPGQATQLPGPIIMDPVIDSTAYLPTDPYLATQWGLHNSTTIGADIDILKAWELTTGSQDIKVAVIDTGVDYTHPDLKENIWVNTLEQNGLPGVDDDNNGYIDDIHGYDFFNNDGDPMDDHGHGSHCAGIIGASHNNQVGIAGINQKVTIVPIKFLSPSGTVEDAIRSIDYAITVGVDIMSNSWGGDPYSKALKDAIIRANDHGIVFITAAGNYGSNNDVEPFYPSGYLVDNVISVASYARNAELSFFSNYGSRSVDLLAPGSDILSTVPNNKYESLSGTSMAAPFVSGVLALLFDYQGRISPKEARDRLINSSKQAKMYREKVVANGRVSAFNLLTDTFPLSAFPNEDEWITHDLEEPFESQHNYQDKENYSRSFTIPGARFVRARIRRFSMEKRFDFLILKAPGSDDELEKITGNGAQHITDYVEGDTLILNFVSDGSINYWGFAVDQIDYIK